MADTVIIPEGLKGTRYPTPVADRLEQRLAPYVMRLERMSPTGRHPHAAKLAKVVRAVRRMEVTSQRTDGDITEAARKQAEERIGWIRDLLDRSTLSNAMAELLREF